MKKIFSVEWPNTAGQVWINSDDLIESLSALFTSGKFCSIPIKIEDVTEVVSDYYNLRQKNKEKGNRVSKTSYKHLLFTLLAIIHRDGGHYNEEHGTEKATEDAIKLINSERSSPRFDCAILDETCIDCEENCIESGE